MKTFAVIDTNVIVSAMLTHNQESPTRFIIEKVRLGQIIPMMNQQIMEEYVEVLSRSKFKLNPEAIQDVKCLFEVRGVHLVPETSEHPFIDPDDYIFYATYLLKEDAYLVTGNLRHYPVEPRIIPPADMMRIIKLSETSAGTLLSEPEHEYISVEKQARLQRAWEAIERSGREAVVNGTADMSMEEIDEEIRLYRKSR